MTDPTSESSSELDEIAPPVEPSRPAVRMRRVEDARFVLLVSALAVEGGLLMIGLVVGWFLNWLPSEDWSRLGINIGYGLAATAPMLVLLWVFSVVDWEPLREIEDVLDDTLLPLFQKATMAEFALVSLLAGLGEEFFFRGVLQNGLAQWLGAYTPYGPWIALVIASLAFGFAHAITWAYVVITAIVGVYLGWVYMATESVLVVIIAHALYDFIALIYLVRFRDDEEPQQS
jgi:membrane protease YdiL (CAAX protease family)